MNIKNYLINKKEELEFQKLIKKNEKSSIIPGILNPIKFTIYEGNVKKDEILADEFNEENCPLDKGAKFGGNRFGFIIINKTANEEKVYPTQCRIKGISIENDIIKVYEEGKYHPWEFDLNGKELKCATFEFYSRGDIKYISENFNIDAQEEQNCAKVNSYRNNN